LCRVLVGSRLHFDASLRHLAWAVATAGCHGSSLHHGRLPRLFTSPRPVATALHFTTAGCYGSTLHHCRLLRLYTSPRPVATALHFTTAGCYGSTLHHCRLPRRFTSPRPVATALHFTTAGCHGLGRKIDSLYFTLLCAVQSIISCATDRNAPPSLHRHRVHHTSAQSLPRRPTPFPRLRTQPPHLAPQNLPHAKQDPM
jgi:hypothetical protein